MFSCLVVAILSLSALAITTKSLLRSATYLLLVLVCTAGLYVFLNYDFLAAAQISIYAGGILILIVFAIYLTGTKLKKWQKQQLKKISFASLIFIVGFAFIAFILLKYNIYGSSAGSASSMAESATGGGVESVVSMAEIGEVLTGTGKHQYLLPFEILSILLFVSIIGGIVIARRK
jgi:NADH-quinone oxidoreductase subunit J